MLYELTGIDELVADLDLRNTVGPTGPDLEFYTFWGTVPDVAIGDRPSEQFKHAGTDADPKNVYANRQTGGLFMAPKRPGKYTMWTVAVDPGISKDSGYQSFDPEASDSWSLSTDAVVVARWDFAVEGNELSVALDPSGSRVTRPGVRYTDPVTFAGPFIAGESYRFAALMVDKNKTTVSTGTFDDITYTLSDDAPISFLVQARNGEVFGQFDEPGEYSFALQAQDASGARQVVEQMSFVVIEPPVFSLKLVDADQMRMHLGDDYVFPTSFHPRTPYKIAPRLIDRAGTTVSRGSVDQITFTLSDDAPPSFFVQAKSGTVFGTFDEARKYNFSLLARDASGQVAAVEDFVFDVVDKPVFGTSPDWNPEVEMTDMIRAKYQIGTTYDIPGPKREKYALFANPAGGEPLSTSYKLEFSPWSPGKFLVDTETGEMLAQPMLEGSYNTSLLAVDRSGATTVVRQWSYDVEKRPRFRISDSWNPSAAMTAGILPKYNLSQPYPIPGPQASVHFEDQTGSVSFSLGVVDAESGAAVEEPDGTYFVVSRTGKMSIQTEKTGRYTATLRVQDESGAQPLNVKIWDFEVLSPDTAELSYGPNNRGCGPGVSIDEIEFDQMFSCDCLSTKFEGDNCDITPPSPAAATATEPDDDGAAWVIPLVLVVVFLVMAIAAFALYKRQQYKLKVAVFDFKAECERMREAGDTEINSELVPREIKRGYVSKIDVLGAGAFGEVWKGMLDESKEKGGVPG